MRPLILLACLAGCDDDSGTNSRDLSVSDALAPADLAGADLSFASNCGQPGDVGNDLGVGRFCMGDSDCAQGTFCLHDVSPPNFVCTRVCNPDGGNVACGAGARCDCATPSMCACFPDPCP